jgi:hypothetical protein
MTVKEVTGCVFAARAENAYYQVCGSVLTFVSQQIAF